MSIGAGRIPGRRDTASEAKPRVQVLPWDHLQWQTQFRLDDAPNHGARQAKSTPKRTASFGGATTSQMAGIDSNEDLPALKG